jgi:hypothetical protein
MKRCAAVTALIMLLSSAAYAAAPSEASLKGTYAFQVSDVQQVSWYKSVSATCFGIKYTSTIGGQSVANVITAGTMTFSGTGTLSSIAATKYGKLDQAASNETPTMTCTGNPNQPYTTNAGYPVFYPSAPMDTTGTYTVTSAATGTLTSAGSSADEVIDISLGQFNAAGVAGVFLMRQTEKNNGEGSTGIGVLR